MKYILDTNIIIYFLDGSLTPKGFAFVLNSLQNQESSISVITKIETLGFQFPTISSEQKAEQFINSLPIFQFSDSLTDKTIEVRKNHKIKVADAIIASTALLYNLTVITRNEKDFKNISGLNFVNPFTL